MSSCCVVFMFSLSLLRCLSSCRFHIFDVFYACLGVVAVTLSMSMYFCFCLDCCLWSIVCLLSFPIFSVRFDTLSGVFARVLMQTHKCTRGRVQNRPCMHGRSNACFFQFVCIYICLSVCLSVCCERELASCGNQFVSQNQTANANFSSRWS